MYAKAVLINNDLLKTGALSSTKMEKMGVITFHEDPSGTLSITGTISGLNPGKHGMHVHELGDVSGGCESAKDHFNPTNLIHGDKMNTTRHVGDFGNVEAGPDGVAQVNIQDSLARLSGPNSIIGRTLIVHVGEDDLGMRGDPESLKTGNVGPGFACGVVGKADSG